MIKIKRWEVFYVEKKKTASDKNRCTAQLDPTAVNNGIFSTHYFYYHNRCCFVSEIL